MTLAINYNGTEYICIIGSTSIQIRNSCECANRKGMKYIISILSNKFPDHVVFKRSINSLIRE